LAKRETLGKMIDLVRVYGASPIILHVAQPDGCEPELSIVSRAKQELFALATEKSVACVDSEPLFRARGGPALFKHAYHPNERGSALLAESVAQVVREASHFGRA